MLSKCSTRCLTAETGIEMPRDNLEAWTGHKCKIFWPDDAEWYDAVVRLYDRSSGKHNVWYSYDHQVSLLPSLSIFTVCAHATLLCLLVRPAHQGSNIVALPDTAISCVC